MFSMGQETSFLPTERKGVSLAFFIPFSYNSVSNGITIIKAISRPVSNSIEGFNGQAAIHCGYIRHVFRPGAFLDKY